MANQAASPTQKELFDRWIEKRIPPSKKIRLSQRNIFIFPTRSGFVFAILLVLLVLGAINYQASLVYAVAFLLGSLFLIAILYTFRNLSGLSLELVESRPGFVGESLEFKVRVQAPRGHGREGIQLGWKNTTMHWADLSERQADTVSLYAPALARGWMNPGRLLVETYFPLGLLRAWTWVDLRASALVYPKPIFQPFPSMSSGQLESGMLVDPTGSDDFTDLRNYQPGDPVKHILWRSYARSEAVVVKQFASYVEPRLCFDLDELAGDLEQRLCRMTGLILEATRLEREFSVQLGANAIAPGVGKEHMQQVLRLVALYGLD